MPLKLYAHPFSSYCQKVLIALYENDTVFEYRMLDPGDTEAQAELEALWPFKRFPVLVDDGRPVVESSIIIEHLALHHSGPMELIPQDANTALQVRLMDRFFDQYVMTPMQKIVGDSLRAEGEHDPVGVADAHRMLDTAYGWLNEALAGNQWGAGETFSLADCAAAPSLFYADWVHPISQAFPRVQQYRQQLLARPSFARAVEETRPTVRSSRSAPRTATAPKMKGMEKTLCTLIR